MTSADSNPSPAVEPPIAQVARPNHHLTLCLTLVAVVAAGVFLRCRHMTDVMSRSPDERVYTEYARTLAERGVTGYRDLFRAYNADAGQWLYPAPTRFGFVFMAALVMKATGVRDSRAGAAVSWLASVLSLILLAWVGLRFFNPWVAVLSVAFLAFSLPELGMARRSWQDATFGFLGLLLTYLTCEIRRSPQRKIWYGAFFAVGTLCLLIKETAYFSYGGCCFWLACVFVFSERLRKPLVWLVLGGMASLAVTLGVWTFLAGDPQSALSAVSHLLTAAVENPYTINYSGPWYQFFYLLWLVGPFTAAMAAIGLAASGLPAIHRQLALTDFRMAGLTAFMAIIFFGLAGFGPKLQNLRITSPADGAYCLLAGLGYWTLLCFVKTRLRRDAALTIVAAVGLAVAGVRDYRAFTTVVVNSGMEDLSVRGIRGVLGR